MGIWSEVRLASCPAISDGEKNVASVKYVGVILEEIRHSHGERFRRARLVGAFINAVRAEEETQERY